MMVWRIKLIKKQRGSPGPSYWWTSHSTQHSMESDLSRRSQNSSLESKILLRLSRPGRSNNFQTVIMLFPSQALVN